MYAHSLPALVYKYLILNGSVSIPGFGNLEISRSPSKNDFAEKEYSAPEYLIRFRNSSTALTSSFIRFLERNQLVTDNIENDFQVFSKDIKSHIRTEGKLDWGGLGTFTQLSDDFYVFQERVKSIRLFKIIPYKHVLREKIEHNVLVGDTEQSNIQMEAFFDEQNATPSMVGWKKSFLILLFIASLFLFYRFTKGNFTIFQHRIEKVFPAIPPKTYSKQ